MYRITSLMQIAPFNAQIAQFNAQIAQFNV